MPTFLIVLMALAATASGEAGPDDYNIPVRIHFIDKPAVQVWIRYGTGLYTADNPENGTFKRPIPGRNVLYLNKGGRTDSIEFSEKLRALPDGLNFLVRRTMSYAGVRLIEDITSDSLQAFADWEITWLEPAAAELVMARKPIFMDQIQRDASECDCFEHVYNYDSALTKEMVRRWYRKGGRNNPELKKAMEENRLILVLKTSI
jgi:hypothetical protein